MSDPTESPASFALRRFLGFDLSTTAPGRGEATLAIRDDHLNPNGVVHGGVLFTMIDTAMGLATMSVLPAGEICASIEVQIRYLRAVTSGDIRVEAEVLQRRRRIVHLEARTFTGGGELAALATGSFAVIPADDGGTGRSGGRPAEEQQ